MKAEITFKQLWYNSGLCSFFLREQSERTIKLMLELVEEPTLVALDAIEDYCEETETDLDSLEELFYSYSAEDCAREIGLTLTEDED